MASEPHSDCRRPIFENSFIVIGGNECSSSADESAKLPFEVQFYFGLKSVWRKDRNNKHKESCSQT